MEQGIKEILNNIGFNFINLNEIDGQMISRDILLDEINYLEIVDKIKGLKQYLSSTTLSSLHNNAAYVQQWPLLNLTRQLLKFYGFLMIPIRKSNGYEQDGTKKYKRFFLIKQNNQNKNN